MHEPATKPCLREKESQPGVELALVAIVTVTYNPDFAILSEQLGQLPAAALRVLVDNTSRPDCSNELARLAAKHDSILLLNDVNVGLAAGLNQGVQHALQVLPACQFLLLLDQDTEPGADGVARLVASYDRIVEVTGKAFCIGPRLIDAVTGLDHGFHQIVGWRWTRRFPPPGNVEPVPLANLNGSGTLIPVALFNELGGLEEDFFIDHVDTEWAFRVLAAGHRLYGIPDISFRHRMGEHSLRFWFLRWRLWPDRSPQRHYYLFRNAVRLMRRSYVPWVWKVWASVKLFLTILVHAIFDSQRGPQIHKMVKGIRDGFHLVKSDSVT